jgi:hypothetical protein
MNARTGHDPSGFIRKSIHISITDHYRDKIYIRLKQDRIPKKTLYRGKKGGGGTLMSMRSKQNTTIRRKYHDFTVNFGRMTILMCIVWNLRPG